MIVTGGQTKGFLTKKKRKKKKKKKYKKNDDVIDIAKSCRIDQFPKVLYFMLRNLSVFYRKPKPINVSI